MLRLFNDRPVQSSEECLVRYNLMDRLDSFLSYAFVDESAPILNSLPLEIKLQDDLRIQVKGLGGGPYKGKLPDTLKDLRQFMPQIHKRTQDSLTVQRLFVPGEKAPRALRRVLGSLIRSLRPGLNLNTIHEMTLSAENQVLEANKTYYHRLQDLTRTAQSKSPDESKPPGREATLEALSQLAEQQLGHMQEYVGRLGL
jgi:hypothetical protein